MNPFRHGFGCRGTRCEKYFRRAHGKTGEAGPGDLEMGAAQHGVQLMVPGVPCQGGKSVATEAAGGRVSRCLFPQPGGLRWGRPLGSADGLLDAVAHCASMVPALTVLPAKVVTPNCMTLRTA